MITIKARVEMGNLLRGLANVDRQAPYVTARALTLTGKDVKEAETNEIGSVIHSPTPYTMRSLFLQGASASRLQARVWLKDGNRPQHYLLPLIEGGGRPLKRFEQRLRMMGYMRPDERAVPGQAMQLDPYGNLSRGLITKVLSQLRTAVTQGDFSNASNSKRSRAKRAVTQYFASGGPGTKRPVYGKRGRTEQHLPRGIWERRVHAHGMSVRPVLLFVTRTNYSKAFDFFAVAHRVIADRWPVHVRSSVVALNAAFFKRGAR